MAYINLIDKLSDVDKKKIENYIFTTSINKKNFIGLEKWLEQWSHSNQKLYKLLGNKLIAEKDYLYEKPLDAIKQEMFNLYFESAFRNDYKNFYWDFVKESKSFSDKDVHFFNHLTDVENFTTDKIAYGIKYRKNPFAKMLQIPVGTKPMKAFQKIINYFDKEWNWNLEHFEEFRLAHSRVLNDKIIKGKLCLSIHPLDYMTMSDNGLSWTSCMSWIEKGCYHVGTVEMMNSNNVLCGYIMSSKGNDEWDFVTKANRTSGENINISDPAERTWNNKKWRQLVYTNKNIIMTGKSYPYYNEKVSKELLTFARELAKENLNWEYKYGIERYKDMIHINSFNRMDRNKNWARFGGNKHNIIWDTKGMYNDMLNDNDYEYWCVRNKVTGNKVISVSGKCNCVRCNGEIITWDCDYNYLNYNDRFANTGSVVCESCAKDFTCRYCSTGTPLQDYKYIIVDDKKIRVCSQCYEKYAKICPCCGASIWVEDFENVYITRTAPYLIKDSEMLSLNNSFRCVSGVEIRQEKAEKLYKDNAESLYMCKECGKHLKEEGALQIGTIEKDEFGTQRKIKIEFFNPGAKSFNDVEKFRYINLKNSNKDMFTSLYTSEDVYKLNRSRSSKIIDEIEIVENF